MHQRSAPILGFALTCVPANNNSHITIDDQGVENNNITRNPRHILHQLLPSVSAAAEN